MTIDVHLVCMDGYGMPIFASIAPWLNSSGLLDAYAFDPDHDDPLTSRARISRADAIALLDRGDTVIAEDLRRHVWSAATREVEIVIREPDFGGPVSPTAPHRRGRPGS
jgi:hypothetical protein